MDGNGWGWGEYPELQSAGALNTFKWVSSLSLCLNAFGINTHVSAPPGVWMDVAAHSAVNHACEWNAWLELYVLRPRRCN